MCPAQAIQHLQQSYMFNGNMLQPCHGAELPVDHSAVLCSLRAGGGQYPLTMSNGMLQQSCEVLRPAVPLSYFFSLSFFFFFFFHQKKLSRLTVTFALSIISFQ